MDEHNDNRNKEIEEQFEYEEEGTCYDEEFIDDASPFPPVYQKQIYSLLFKFRRIPQAKFSVCNLFLWIKRIIKFFLFFVSFEKNLNCSIEMNSGHRKSRRVVKYLV